MGIYKHILQGANDPIILEAEETNNFVKVSAALVHGGRVEKTWEPTEIIIQDNTLILPIEEAESMGFTKGYSELDIKALDSNKRVVFFDIVKCIIDERKNKTSMISR